MIPQPNEIQIRYPHLDHFIGTEFLQDFDSEVTITAAVDRFVSVYDRSSSLSVVQEIQEFLRNQSNNIEAAFDGFRPQVYPPGFGMTTAEWLAEIARVFELRLEASV